MKRSILFFTLLRRSLLLLILLSTSSSLLAQNPESHSQLVFEQQLEAINLSIAGTWKGTLTIINPENSETIDIETSFTRIVTSDNGLDFATLTSRALLWEIYNGNGVYRTSSYQLNGEIGSNDSNFYISDLVGPDDNGDWKHTWTYINDDGNESKSVYTLTDGVMSFVDYSRKYQSGEEFIQIGVGASYIKE